MSSEVCIKDNYKQFEKTLNHIIKKMNDYTVEVKWTRNKNKDCLTTGGDLNIILLKQMRKHPRSYDFKYGVLSRSSSSQTFFTEIEYF